MDKNAYWGRFRALKGDLSGGDTREKFQVYTYVSIRGYPFCYTRHSFHIDTASPVILS